jgi:hypothetical protein
MRLHGPFRLEEVLKLKAIEDVVTPKRSVQGRSQQSLNHVHFGVRDYIATGISISQGVIGTGLEL